MRFYWLAIGIFSVWRVTHLIASEDGPADIVVRFRRLLGQSFLGSLTDCFNCLSLWVAAPAAFLITRQPLEWFVTWLALSGGACLLERLGHEPVVIQPMTQSAEGDQNVLRSETFETANQSGGENAADSPAIQRR